MAPRKLSRMLLGGIAVLAVLIAGTLVVSVQELTRATRKHRAHGTDVTSKRPKALESARAAFRTAGDLGRETLRSDPPALQRRSPTDGADLRTALDVPWLHPGMCVSANDPRVARRARYLATFIPERVWRATVYVHPQVSPEAVNLIHRELERTHESATKDLNLSSDPPAIYVYPTVDALREFSCAGADALAYYDGAIHLAPTSGSHHGLRASLRHEYVHHVLVSAGIRRPIWFQEAAAMVFAGDRPPDYWRTWRKNPIRLDQMVATFPSTQPKETREVFYAQAFAMMEFLDRLCLARAGCGVAELAAVLESEQVTPERLFDWAAAERSKDLAHTAAPSIWADYETRGDFSPRTLEALLRRARPETSRSSGN